MKFRDPKDTAELKVDMTPMIDIVFQLLVFFIMTYKVTAMEGDYNIKMPATSPNNEIQTDILADLLTVTLNADADRNLASIRVQFGSIQKSYLAVPGQPDALFNSLRNFTTQILSDSGDPGSSNEVEAEIESDFELRYAETVHAIESVSGYKNETGQIVKLIEKIKFRDSK